MLNTTNNTPPIASLEGLRTSIEEAGKRIMANPDHPTSKKLVKCLRGMQKAFELGKVTTVDVFVDIDE